MQGSGSDPGIFSPYALHARLATTLSYLHPQQSIHTAVTSLRRQLGEPRISDRNQLLTCVCPVASRERKHQLRRYRLIQRCSMASKPCYAAKLKSLVWTRVVLAAIPQPLNAT